MAQFLDPLEVTVIEVAAGTDISVCNRLDRFQQKGAADPEADEADTDLVIGSLHGSSQ